MVNYAINLSLKDFSMLKKILILILFTATLLNATTPTKQNVTKLYVATLDRAPDNKGLNYWVESSGLFLEEIAMSFFDQPELNIKYPKNTTNREFIKSIYNNLFKRVPDSKGWDYWEAELDNATIPRSLFILSVINGAIDNDKVILNNKAEVALYFADKGLENFQIANDVLTIVTVDDDSVIKAKKIIDDIEPNTNNNINILNKENITKLYVATFDRAPDSAGLDYWLNSSFTLEQTAMSFFDQEETQAKYPPSYTNANFIKTVYQNLFDRDPDDAGFVYWLKAIDDGAVGRSVFILAAINGALGDDAVLLDNKTEVGIYFADKGLNDYDSSILVMAELTEDPVSVEVAKSLIDELAGTSISEEDIKEAEEVIENAMSKIPSDIDMTEDLLSTKLDELIASLRNDTRVTRVDVSDDKLDINIINKSGLHTGILFVFQEEDSTYNLTNTTLSAAQDQQTQRRDTSSNYASETKYIPAMENKNVLILEPFATEAKLTYDGWDATTFRKHGFKVTRLTDNDVTPESFKNWDNFGIIIVRTHGSKIGSLIAGNEATNEIQKKYVKDWEEKRITLTRQAILNTNLTASQKFFKFINAAGDNKLYTFSIKPSFIINYSKKLPNSLIWLDACNSMIEENNISKILRDKGAKTIVGYDGYGHISYVQSAGKFALNKLFTENNITDSLAYANKETSDDNWISAKVIPFSLVVTIGKTVLKGDGSLKIVKEETSSSTTTSTIKKTGQTKSYNQDGDEVTDGSVKDDGHYQKGVTPNYTREGEIVTDHITGLMWQDDAEAKTVKKQWLTDDNYDDCKDNGNNCENTSGDTATTYCSNLDLGGYDWRLPTSKELESIIDYGRYDPAINPIFDNTSSYYYWSSTTYKRNSNDAWVVGFSNGYVGSYGKGTNHFVRCVRAGE